MKVLVVDDNVYTLMFIRNYLAMKSCQDVDTAKNGTDAIELLKQNKYDLIFLDIQLPDMNGFAIVNYLKSLFDPAPVVMMTAYPNLVVEHELKKYGIEHILLKPFVMDKVDNIIDRYCVCV